MVPRTVKKMFSQQREHGFSDHIDEALIAVTLFMLHIVCVLQKMESMEFVTTENVVVLSVSSKQALDLKIIWLAEAWHTNGRHRIKTFRPKGEPCA